MRIFLSILALYSPLVLAKCDFKSPIEKVFSLSGPLTVTLKELGLLKSEKIKGISVFHPVLASDYAGEIFPGGVFLSKETFARFNGSVVFYDEGRDIDKIFSEHPLIKSTKISTRGLSPRKVVDKTLRVLEENLSGCEGEIKALKNKVSKVEGQIIEKLKTPRSLVFYLGEFKNDRPPELIIVNDGVVGWLVANKKIISYPSQLAYINWSARIMSTLPSNTLHIALKDSGRDNTREVRKHSEKEFTLMFPGVLTPGITQLEAMSFLLDKI